MVQGSAWTRAPVVGRRTDASSTGSCVVASSCALASALAWLMALGPDDDDDDPPALAPLAPAAASLPMIDC